MLPHQSILHLPPTSKQRRRTIQVTPPSTSTASLPSTAFELYIRELTIDQAGLGCAAWDASILLARYLHYAHHQLLLPLSSLCILEVGSGVGIPGILCGRYASKCVLTDYDDACIDNLRYNIKVNANADDDAPTAVQQLKQNLAASTSACALDWHAVGRDGFVDPTGLGGQSCDLIVGSEVMYTLSPQHRLSLSAMIAYYLKPTGRFLCMQSANREGMSEFVSLMHSSLSFHCSIVPVRDDLPWMVGMALGGEKGRRGFVQREEQYVLYEFTRGVHAGIDGAVLPVQYALDENKIRALATETVDDLTAVRDILQQATACTR